MKRSLRPSQPDTWDEYAPFFNAEEGTVFSHDLREMEFYRLLRLRHPGACIEIGAGAGRLSRSLFNGGFMAALEPSRAMMASWTRAQMKLAHRVRGIGQDLPFKDGCFGFACFPYNGLQCILERDGRRSVFREAHRVLAAGGIFLFEISPAFARRPPEQRTRRYSVELPDGGILSLDEEVNRPECRNSVVYDMIYSSEYQNGACDSRRVVLELAAFNVLEAVDDARNAGFSVERLWGDYDETPFDPEMSPRLLVPAMKE